LQYFCPWFLRFWFCLILTAAYRDAMWPFAGIQQFQQTLGILLSLVSAFWVLRVSGRSLSPRHVADCSGSNIPTNPQNTSVHGFCIFDVG